MRVYVQLGGTPIWLGPRRPEGPPPQTGTPAWAHNCCPPSPAQTATRLGVQRVRGPAGPVSCVTECVRTSGAPPGGRAPCNVCLCRGRDHLASARERSEQGAPTFFPVQQVLAECAPSPQPAPVRPPAATRPPSSGPGSLSGWPRGGGHKHLQQGPGVRDLCPGVATCVWQPMHSWKSESEGAGAEACRPCTTTLEKPE